MAEDSAEQRREELIRRLQQAFDWDDSRNRKCRDCKFYAAPKTVGDIGYCEHSDSPTFGSWPLDHWEPCAAWWPREIV